MISLPSDNDMESAWLLALQAGDQLAFTQIYDRYWSRLFTVAYNYTRSRETAQEVVQEVFVSLWVKRESLIIQQSLEKYLYGAVKFRLYDLLDKQKNALRYQDYAIHHLPISEETTEQHLAFEETTRLIQQQIDGFSEMTRQVFLLRRFDGLPVAQIASILNVSSKVVEYHLTKALRLLRLHLADTYSLIIYLALTIPF